MSQYLLSIFKLKVQKVKKELLLKIIIRKIHLDLVLNTLNILYNNLYRETLTQRENKN